MSDNIDYYVAEESLNNNFSPLSRSSAHLSSPAHVFANPIPNGAYYRVRGITLTAQEIPSTIAGPVSPVNQPSGSVAWARKGGGSLNDAAACIARNPDGSFIMAGYFKGTANFGTPGVSAAGLTSPTGRSAIFIVKYDNEGNHVWSVSYGGSSGDLQPIAIAVDSSGNIYLCGLVSGTANLGGGDLPGGHAWIASYTSTGVHRWSYSFGIPTGTNDAFTTIKINSAGNVIVGGRFAPGPLPPTLNFGTPGHPGSPVTNAYQGPSIVLASYSHDGNHLWSRMYQSGGGPPNVYIVLDSVDNIYLAGDFTGYLQLGDESTAIHTSGGQQQWMYVAKIAPDGSYGASSWSFPHGYPLKGTVGLCIGIDPQYSTIAVAGYFSIRTDLGGGTVNGTASDASGFLAKYSAIDGHYMAATYMNPVNACGPTAVMFGSQNEVYMTCYLGSSGVYDFSGRSMPVTPENQYDAFVAKYNNSLVLQDGWPLEVGGTGVDSAKGLVSDLSGNPVVCGFFSPSHTPNQQPTPVMFGTIPLTSYGNSDAFIMKVNK